MYSYTIPEDKKDMYAASRAEDVESSYKDLAQVCGRVRGKTAQWAVSFLELASTGAVPILYKRHNKNLGHRRELGGVKGRYPWKAAKAVLKTLLSALANSQVKGLSEDLVIVHICANRKHVYPRLSPKGRRFRQNYDTSRIEVIVKEKVESSRDEKKARMEKAKAKSAKQKPAEEKAEAKGAAKVEGAVHGAKEAKPETKPEPTPEVKAEEKKAEKAEQNAEKKAERKQKVKSEHIRTE
ncbi:MAG: 50S ribosomal protein L22 [Candidatus Micrarchaeia archaeon]